MSKNHFTKTATPNKPRPDFPLFPHATGRWAKKIKGKMHYFGPWDDPDGAEQRYRDFIDGRPIERPAPAKTDSAKPDKPSKPSATFPLYSHPSGQWAKKIRGQTHYFGPWSDPQGALDKYLKEKDDLHAGRKPRPDTDALTVKALCNAFIEEKQALVDNGELSPRTLTDYEDACREVLTAFGAQRLVDDLRPEDFANLRKQIAKKWGSHRLAKTIQCIRSLFKHGFEAGLIAIPVRFGPGFKRPSKKTIRLEKAKQGAKLFTRLEILTLLLSVPVHLEAMILLGINCGFGNTDSANLPLSALDLDNGMLNYPRPKTGIPRRCPLWPETVAALRETLARRPTPKNPAHADLVFVTKYGDSWGKDTSDNPISKEIAKLLKSLHINGRKGLGYYTLRHTFRTTADESRDQPAVDHIMGHESTHMSSHYRETISNERLRAVADYVRSWLFDQARPAM